MSSLIVGCKDSGNLNGLYWSTRVTGVIGRCYACRDLPDGFFCFVVPYTREYFYPQHGLQAHVPQHKESGEWHIIQQYPRKQIN